MFVTHALVVPERRTVPFRAIYIAASVAIASVVAQSCIMYLVRYGNPLFHRAKNFCISTYRRISMILGIIGEGLQVYPQYLVKHPGFYCDLCGCDILGIRYQCINCLDYSLCSHCETLSRFKHHPLHVFAKIEVPLPKGCHFPTFPIIYPGM